MARQLILDRYRPIAEAGAGGFGTVIVAWDTRIQRKVAIKCIELSESDARKAALENSSQASDSAKTRLVAPSERPDADASPAFSSNSAPSEPERAPSDGPRACNDLSDLDVSDEARWLENVPGLDEARTAAMLQDQNIAAVYDFEVQGTTAFLIMEYVEGMTLAELLRDHGDSLTLDMIAAIFGGVAHALEVAHKNYVLHLDIKPDNILVNRDGVVKVTDFGLATLADAQGLGTAGAGTIGYMPLEQMRQEPLDVRCDEWALASVTYEMLTGENPFLARDVRRAAARIQDAELVLPSLCWEALDPSADDVLFFALDPDPDERFDSVKQFADELAPLLGSAKKGKSQLSAIVSGAGDFGDEPDEPDDVSVESHRGRGFLRERLAGREKEIAARGFSAIAAGLMAAAALSLIPAAAGATNPVFWIGVLIAAAFSAVWSHIGAVVTVCAFGVALFFVQAPLAGVAVIAFGIAWWYFVGRFSRAAAGVALAFPFLGALGIPHAVVGFAAAAPLAAGLFLRVRDALATTALGFVLAVTLAGAAGGSVVGWDAGALFSGDAAAALAEGGASPLQGTSQEGSPDPAAGSAAGESAVGEGLAGAGLYASDNPLAGKAQDNMRGLLVRPETWAVFASWLAAAALLSACCSRRLRILGIAGVVLASGVLLAGAVAAMAIGATADFAMDWSDLGAYVPSADFIAPIVIGCIAAITTATFGVPERK